MGLTNRHRILISAYACEPNKGSEPGVGWNWSVHLAERYEVYVITRLNNKESIEQYLEEHPIEHLHFYYHDCSKIMRKLKKMPNGIFVYYKQWQREILPVARKIVKDEKIELVHHLTFNEFRTPGKLYKLEIPFVWGPIGGGQFYNPVFGRAYFRKTDIMKEYVRNFINHCYLTFSGDIRKVVKNASAILVADQSTDKILPSRRRYIRLLETAYNLERNPIKTYQERSVTEPLRLLWVGGLWPRKGLKLLIDALGNSDFRNFRLEIIGEGQEKKACEKLVKKYEIQDKVIFSGKLTYQEVNTHYDDADVFVFTSLRDTSGNVVLEAMSHGLPVITLNHHGAGEIVTNETGTLIEVSRYDQIQKDIISAITSYYRDREKIVLQGKAARSRIEKVYSWQHNLEIMTQVYEKVLGAKE